MHTGTGKELWMRSSIEENRMAGLMDRSLFSEDELEKLEIEFPKGGGKTNPWTYTVSTEVYQTSYSTISPDYVDLRHRKEVGDFDL